MVAYRLLVALYIILKPIVILMQYRKNPVLRKILLCYIKFLV